MAEAFLHARQHCLVVSGFYIDHTVGQQSCLGDRRREQVALGHTPQNFSWRPCGDAGSKKRCRSAIDCSLAAAPNFVKRA
ncbi:hypothetical protein BLM15_29995 (plasmid) [Bosea sp. Tri-49]|nr:hypothetical protein BLM15_29995 [Bosea sp. Tri-49]